MLSEKHCNVLLGAVSSGETNAAPFCIVIAFPKRPAALAEIESDFGSDADSYSDSDSDPARRADHTRGGREYIFEQLRHVIATCAFHTYY